DATVTGVQTCALPICKLAGVGFPALNHRRNPERAGSNRDGAGRCPTPAPPIPNRLQTRLVAAPPRRQRKAFVSPFCDPNKFVVRSEERRVGKECRCGG